MTILAFVLDPQSEEERAFTVPVASESAFNTRWRPVIDALGLQWLSLFSTGVDIQEQDKEEVLDELRKFSYAYTKQYGTDEVIDRVDLLMTRLPEPFKTRRGVVVYIG